MLKTFIRFLPVIILINALVIFFIYSSEVEREFAAPVASLSGPIREMVRVVKGEPGESNRGVERGVEYQDAGDGVLTVPILYYHHVGFIKDAKDAFRKLVTVTPSNFKEQMTALADEGVSVITLKALIQGLEGKGKIPKKSVILTFDDGYRDFYDYAFPILKSLGFSSINFIILNSLDMDDNLTIPQVREMLGSGLFEVGSHSVSHVNLSTADPAKVERETADSKDALERRLKTKIAFFAYPGGYFNEQTETAVKDAGYLGSVSTVGGINHTFLERYRLKRVKVGNWSGDALKARLRSLGFDI